MDLKQIGTLLLYSGIVLLMISLIYMIVNLSNADNFISIWMVFIIAGVLSTFWGSIFLAKHKDRLTNN